MSGDVKRPDLGKAADAVGPEEVEEILHGPEIGPARVAVAQTAGEEFPVALPGGCSACGYWCRGDGLDVERPSMVQGAGDGDQTSASPPTTRMRASRPSVG